MRPEIVSGLDFGKTPYVVIWEMTRACALKCVHCRAEAIEHRNPDELSDEQAFALMREIHRFGKPLVVLTGGDPLTRPDAAEVVRYGHWLGLPMAMTPSATPRVTKEKLVELKTAGLERLAVSLDGPDAAAHDAFRQVPGSYDWTIRIMRWANEIGLPLQINSTVSSLTLREFDRIAQLLGSFRIALWSVFFIVPVGRAGLSQVPKAREIEKIFWRMAALSRTGPFPIKSTEAPQFRRVLLQYSAERDGAAAGSLSEGSFNWSNACRAERPPRPVVPVNDGKGFVFISHTGEIYPSGFLPVSAGNVKRDSLVNVYRDSELFRTLRDPSKLKGKCGACEYRAVCGGSRARAYAVRGDWMAADPYCAHVPNAYVVEEEEKSFW